MWRRFAQRHVANDLIPVGVEITVYKNSIKGVHYDVVQTCGMA